MTSSAKRYVLWVTRDDASRVADASLRQRADVLDPDVEIRTAALGKWDIAAIPAGSRFKQRTAIP